MSCQLMSCDLTCHAEFTYIQQVSRELLLFKMAAPIDVWLEQRPVTELLVLETFISASSRYGHEVQPEEWHHESPCLWGRSTVFCGMGDLLFCDIVPEGAINEASFTSASCSREQTMFLL